MPTMQTKRPKTTGAIELAQPTPKPLPVTLLSGFLGSGKTTLLEHILKNKEGLKCAVIVNDMAELNIDAEIVTNRKILQREEKLIQLQNGCICCTLRGDLLDEVAALAKTGDFDYLIIESSGISEPKEVAETFAFKVEDGARMMVPEGGPRGKTKLVPASALESLTSQARLDTTVTVVDAANFFNNFNSYKKISDEDSTREDDERNIVDLLNDQLEWANVVVVNKVDMVSAEEVSRITQLIRTLNPKAEILTANYAKVDLNKILNTGLFDIEEARQRDGWMDSLNEGQADPDNPEYGITSFVYRAIRPFHPVRLHDLFYESFILQEQSQREEGTNIDGKDRRQECVESKKKGPFATVLRSKGFVWLASRESVIGEWSQAGVFLQFTLGGIWMCEFPRNMLPPGAIYALEKGPYSGTYLDRRQEIVMIGANLDREAVTKALDSCLLTPSEMAKYIKQGPKAFVGGDPFQRWSTARMLLSDQYY